MKNIWKALCICSCILIGVSAFLPYFSVSGLGVTVSKCMMDGNEGIFVLIIAAVALAFAFGSKFAPTVFLGMASLGMVFVENNSVTTYLGREIDALARALLQKGLGYYCLLAGAIALIFFSVLGLTTKK